MKPSALIANSLWLASALPAWARFRRALGRPAETQQLLLRNALARNAGTAFGQAHGFSGIKSHADFARNVPLCDYDDLKPWIARIMRGENGVLTTERVTHLVPTSGSSGARKLIPFTARLQREFNEAIGAWIVDLYGRHPRLATGAAYWSISPAIDSGDGEQSSVRIGFDDDTAYLGGAKAWLLRAITAVPSELRLVADMDQFCHKTLLHLLRCADLRLVSVWHPSFFTLLLDALPRFWDELLRDIGRTNRARQLLRANPLEPETIWPGLEVISCWGDAHAALAKAELARRFPSAHIQSKGLLATEGFVTLPFAGAYPLAVCSHFFEFIDERGEIRAAHELQAGGIYEVVVTTGGGLWRYRLGDQVEVTHFIGKTPSLRFL
ncbi:MAG TPA: GH3 auxin-responsive promoter family protein, partial [Chthoniobacteraceae bacterium]|nr:GH3 auxin-responsive promoter family protein [Chthoniobacteraceae bacterium]